MIKVHRLSETASPILCLSHGPADLPPAHKQLPHVLLVVDGFLHTLGGGERVVLRLAAMLPQYGFRASILTFELDPASEFQIASAPCPFYLLPLRNTYDRQAWRGALALRRFLREQQIQIVQTFFESSDLWAGVLARVLSPAKVVWSRRDMGILRGGKHALAYRTLRRLPHAVFAVSEQVRQHAITVDGIPPARAHTIHNGLDLPPATSIQPLDPQAARILTVGNIRRVKGHDVLLRALAKVRKLYPQTTCTIAGEVLEPGYFAELQTLVKELDLLGNIHLPGKVTNLRPHLEQAHLFVLPSRSEGFSNALIEAMATGLPTIATRVGGNAEAIEHGVSGLIVSPEDVDALTDAMLELFAAPERARIMGHAAKQTVAARFTTHAMMQKTTQIYGELLNFG